MHRNQDTNKHSVTSITTVHIQIEIKTYALKGELVCVSPAVTEGSEQAEGA